MKFIYLIISLCILCVRCDNHYSSVEVINDEFSESNEMGIDKPEWIVVNRASQFTNRIFTKRHECSRYCIKSARDTSRVNEKNSNKINLVWHLSGDSFEFTRNKKVATTIEKSPEFDFSNEPNRQPEKCEIQLMVGCNNSTNFFVDKNSNQMETLRKDHLTEYSTSRFNVSHDTNELQFKIIGNISWILLEIPTGKSREEPLELSLVRDNDRNEVNLVANYPPPGGWQLKLKGRENLTYSLVVSRGLKVPTTSAPLLSGVNADNLDDEFQNQGFMIYLENTQTTARRRAALRFPEEFESRRHYNSGKVVFPESLEEFSESQIDDDRREAPGQLLRTSDLVTRGKNLPVDVAPETSLLAKPGNVHTVVFTVTNNEFFNILHIFEARSNQFQVVAVNPLGWWIKPGQTIKVAVNIAVPNLKENVVNTVTLHVDRSKSLEAVEKSVYIYVQGSTDVVSDSTRPTVDYEFNNNCAGKLRQERCENSIWSVEITVADVDSGLKSVTSYPNGIQPKHEFTAGTKNPVNFIYTSTCCYTTVEVIATDVNGNTYSRKIDVTAWDNLTTGEIAAIVVGSLLLLLIIVLLILLCIYCCQRNRRSADLSYTQRYGSRAGPSGRLERT